MFTGTSWMQMTSCSGTGICPALLRMDEDLRRMQPPGESFSPEKWQQADQSVNGHVCRVIITSSP